MNVHVKLLLDRFGTKEYVFYKTGEFANPIMILTEGYAAKLLKDLKNAVDTPDYRVAKMLLK